MHDGIGNIKANVKKTALPASANPWCNGNNDKRNPVMIKSLLRILFLGLLLLGVSTSTFAAGVTLAKNHPDVYYVKDGDTLWGIASKFLQDPWQWPAIWQENQQIPNPHLIYPGDKLRLTYVNGQPRITLERGAQGQQAEAMKNSNYPIVKLSPEMKSQPLAAAIPSVSLDSVQTYLMNGQVVDSDEIQGAPYLLASQAGTEIWGEGDVVYVRDPKHQWKNDSSSNYGVYRVGERYVDPETKEVLGYEALLIGHLQLLKVEGDVATMKVTDSRQGLRAGDRIFGTVRHEQLATFFPKAPDENIKGRIIRLFGAVRSVARNDVVVINKGAREGLKEGNLLELEKPGDVVEDEQMNQYVKLPNQRVGTLLLFHVFDRVSYGLIMKSLQPISMDDLAVTPE
jgi:hypothetical protein